MKITDVRVRQFEMPLARNRASPATLTRARATFGDRIKVCSIVPGRLGGCSQDCAFCAQSARWKTGVKAAPMCGVEEVRAAAARAARNGAYAFSLVASGRGVRTMEELERWFLDSRFPDF